MRILQITHFYWPHVGGVEKQVKALNKRLFKKGFKITVVTLKHDRSLKDKEIKDGIEILRIPEFKVKLLGLLFIWFWLLSKRYLIKRSDIVHAHSVLIWYWPFRLIFPKKPVFTTFHGWEGIYPVPRKNILIRRIDSLLAWKNITICDYVEKYYGIKADKIMYTAVNIPRKKDFKKNKNNLVYVGRLDDDTGLRKILKALAYLKGYKIDFCGDGPLREECKKFGKVHGFTDPNPFYEKAFICLSPGHTSILEAFTYKCLVVTTYDNPLKKDYLLMTPFSDWIIAKDSPKDLAEAIKYYRKFPNKTKNKINLAYKWVLSQNWDFATKMYLDLWGIKVD